MTIAVDIPGVGQLELDHLLLDVNVPARAARAALGELR
jgi:hypothetical protein